MNYWLCITNEENWEIIKKHKLWGVSDRNKHQMEKVSLDDGLVFYLKPKKIAGIFKATTRLFRSHEKIFSPAGFASDEVYPNRIRLDPVYVPKKPLDFEELISKLKFITKKKRWGGHLQGRAMRPIPKEDYRTIQLAVKSSL